MFGLCFDTYPRVFNGLEDLSLEPPSSFGSLMLSDSQKKERREKIEPHIERVVQGSR